MRRQEAAYVVPRPLDEVEARLRQVEDWPAFVKGVQSVRLASHRRYVFSVVDGRDVREVTVAVHVDPRAHEIRWESCAGPTYAGTWRLKAQDDGHTRVDLSIASYPTNFRGGLAEMVMPQSTTAVVDLQALERHLMSNA